MQVVKLATILLFTFIISACSSTQTAHQQEIDEFDPNILPETAAGTLAPNGYIRYWEFRTIQGTTVGDLYASGKYPLLYGNSKRIKQMSASPQMIQAAARMAGFLFPQTTGDYYFKLEAQSGGELWLSTDQKEYKKQKIIHVDNNNPNHSATSKFAVRLEAGTPYFIEAIAKMNRETDKLVVYWSYPMPSSETETSMSAMEVIPGTVMRSYGKDRQQAPTKEYLDGINKGYAMGFSDALLGLNYDETYPATDDDFDGIPDRWEEAYALDPTNYSDAASDTDGDGLSAFNEYLFHTEPYLADSDGDGIPDGWEVEKGLDPNSTLDGAADRNGDGTTNLEEWLIVSGTLPPAIEEPPLTPDQGSLYVSWTAPTTRVNNDYFSQDEVSKYILRYQLEGSESYTDIEISDPYATEYLIEPLDPGTYQVSISVVDVNGLESAFSATITKLVE